MSTFACHCGGTVTGVSEPDPERSNYPTFTFTCDGHQGGGERVLLIAKVWGTPADEEALMATMKQPIDHNEQFYLDNPAATNDQITSRVIL